MCPSHYREAETWSSAMTAAVIWLLHKLPVKSPIVWLIYESTNNFISKRWHGKIMTYIMWIIKRDNSSDSEMPFINASFFTPEDNVTTFSANLFLLPSVQ